MARARKAKNPRRRRMDRIRHENLRQHCALVDQQSAEADGSTQDSAGPAATALPSDKDAPGPETTSTPYQKTSSTEPKRQCKHRRLPDRHYYHRHDKMERQYLGLQRRLTAAFDEKIAQGSTALEQWKRDAGALMTKFKRKADVEVEEIRRDLNRMRENHNRQLEFHQLQIRHQMRKLVEVEKKCADLSAKLIASETRAQEAAYEGGDEETEELWSDL